jgi:putative PIN family toxin of toxin-antitoxin system
VITNKAFKKTNDESIQINNANEQLADLMMTLIVDTNVWLDWLLFNDDCVLELKQLHSKNRIRIIATHQMRAELEEVIHRAEIGPKFIARSQFSTLAAIMHEFDRLVVLLPTPPTVFDAPQCKDGDDQIFLDLAIVESANLISKDRAVLAMAKKFKAMYGVEVITPRNFRLD